MQDHHACPDLTAPWLTAPWLRYIRMVSRRKSVVKTLLLMHEVRTKRYLTGQATYRPVYKRVDSVRTFLLGGIFHIISGAEGRTLRVELWNAVSACSRSSYRRVTQDDWSRVRVVRGYAGA